MSACWQGSKWIRPERRYAIYVRDGFACVWCGDTTAILTLDHLFPRNRHPWDNSARNLVTACWTCNSRRQDLPLRRWLRRLRAEGADMGGIVARVRGCIGQELDLEAGRAAWASRKAYRRRAGRHARAEGIQHAVDGEDEECPF